MKNLRNRDLSLVDLERCGEGVTHLVATRKTRASRAEREKKGKARKRKERTSHSTVGGLPNHRAER